MMVPRPLLFTILLIVGSIWSLATLQAEERPIILAHRAGAFEFDENTMEGFRTCYEKGIRGFETDVRMTRDGVLVILHDDSLDRTHTGTGPIEEKTAAELRDILTKRTGQKFLFLDELLEFLADRPDVYIELEMKTSNKKLYPDDRIEEYARKLHSAAEAKRPAGSTYVYSSFDERPLRAIHALDSKAPLSLIVGKPCTPELIDRAKELGADRIACQLDGTSRAAVKAAHQAGLSINCWPGRSEQDFILACGLGVDVHCTDIPVAIKAFSERFK